MPILIIFILLILSIFIVISLKNRLIALKNKVDYANGAINTMCKQRYDLIPNLVASVKQYMQHEKQLLENLVRLRSSTQNNALDETQRDHINNELDQAIKSFNITVENYPDLKANEQFSKLQASLYECEAQLAATRRTYNATVMDYNNAVEMFPTSYFAKRMNYQPKSMITITQAEQLNPNVSNLFS